MVNRALRSLLAEPRPQRPPRRVWRDWLLVAAVVASLTGEVVAREDCRGGSCGAGLVLLLVGVPLWRRTAPLAAVAVMFAALTLSSVAGQLGFDAALPYSLAWVLVLP
jgi:hypothetical protein